MSVLKISNFSGEYDFLSNFYWFDGHTIEHDYQAAKTLNPNEREHILSSGTPGVAKRRGSRATLRFDWEEVKEQFMLSLLRRKFHYAELRKKLLDTGEAELVEGNNWHDNYWGSCTCPRCSNIPKRNRLGHLLMQVRSELRLEEGSGSGT